MIETAKNRIFSVELGRRLGAWQRTAGTVMQGNMAMMARRHADTRLDGRVEMDDAYLGRARPGAKRGRGAPGTTPFVAAVSTGSEGRPIKFKQVPVEVFRKRVIARRAGCLLVPRTEVDTDRYGFWNTLDERAYIHRSIGTGWRRRAARKAPLK